MTYEQWVAREAEDIKSDGCTGVSEWHHECCLEHDLACRWGKNPTDAFRLWEVEEYPLYWLKAEPMTRREADFMFLRCNERLSGKNPITHVRSFFRFVGVRIGALLGIGVRKPS
jgi:hypothetical protein